MISQRGYADPEGVLRATCSECGPLETLSYYSANDRDELEEATRQNHDDCGGVVAFGYGPFELHTESAPDERLGWYAPGIPWPS